LHDTLTGLPNRALLEDRLRNALAEATRHNTAVTVLMMDLDRFKEINDTLGHPVGDALLIEVAMRMHALIRNSDTLSRFGGDELVMVLPNTNTEQAMVVVSKIKSAFQHHFRVDGKDLIVQCSIGGAVFPEDGTDAETLIKRADVAMYTAKKGRLGYSFYDMNSDQHSPDRLSMISELHHAIHSDELLLYYQPKLDLKSGNLYGVEALVRWQHPKRGIVSPDEFIPLAEECGLIVPLTFWVLDNALRQLDAWRKVGMEIPVAINLSTRNIHDLAFADRVQQRLRAWNCEPCWLELEITESAVIDDPVRAMQVLNQLDELGVQLSIDDFGTGYSSLAYLKNLPVDEVKIDRSFILDMDKDPRSLAIVRAMIDLGHQLDLHVVAEGIETKESLDIMATCGCDAIQGYYISKPLPAENIMDVIESWNLLPKQSNKRVK
jgi:diguanylate cyclase (GGDEF)-like protein